ncbi:hypothetical protein LPUS_08510 [Lasallia pustulata]|uniref:Uncharacterized protein n=1 Tax=Lasallia pustulata TaxID=136370 RepID=A0A1W5D5E3_9LECA|nr:hypothetical protein LPUS_08510 [Lasallia pustulata]
MPHKHKRDKSQNKTTSDLPPTTLAHPLPVTKPPKPAPKPSHPSSKTPASNRKRPRDATDDTPRAFARLMAFHTTGLKPRSGLDDGVRPTKKKRKLGTNPTTTTTTITTSTTNPSTTTIPKILPGERLSDFSARVNAALPIAGLISKGHNLEGVPERKTKTEKRMQRLQAEWREAEARRRERDEEARDEAFADGSGEGGRVGDAGAAGKRAGMAKKRGRKRKGSWGVDGDGDDDDPWAVVAAKRNEEAQGGGRGLVGLHDVVLAPPRFSKPLMERFRVRDGAGVEVGDVPAGAGSLRRREELGVVRRGVVEGYRLLRGGWERGKSGG